MKSGSREMTNNWSLTKNSPPQAVIKELNFSTSLQPWARLQQRENFLAEGQIVTWYEINPQPGRDGYDGSREMRQLERIIHECAAICGRSKDVQGPSSGGLIGLLQGVCNTVRVKEDLATMYRFHQALRTRRLDIARIMF